MASYDDNWQRYGYLEKQAEQAQQQYQVARNEHATAELGSIEWSQLGAAAEQKKGEWQTAENALSSFEQQVQQTNPEQVDYLKGGIAPEAANKLIDFEVSPTMVAGAAVTAIGGAIETGILHPEILAGASVVAGDMIEVAKAIPTYVDVQLEQRVTNFIEQSPPAAVESQIAAAVELEAQKADQAAFKQREVEKLQTEHNEQLVKQEAMIKAFEAKQADKDADVKAKQAELADKARQDLAEKQDREMKEKLQALERSQAEAKEAQEKAQALEAQRNER